MMEAKVTVEVVVSFGDNATEIISEPIRLLDRGGGAPDLVADDGIFWVTTKEFFTYFETVYVCAKDMSEFLQ